MAIRLPSRRTRRPRSASGCQRVTTVSKLAITSPSYRQVRAIRKGAPAATCRGVFFCAKQIITRSTQKARRGDKAVERLEERRRRTESRMFGTTSKHFLTADGADLRG